MFEISARQIYCFSRYPYANFFRKSFVSDHLHGRSRRALSTTSMFSWYKNFTFRKINLSVLTIFQLKFFSKNIYIRRSARRIVPSCLDMFFWYNNQIISQTDLLFLQIYPLNFSSKIVCIRRTAGRVVPSCHLFHGHVLLIQCSDNQRDRSAVSLDIPTQFFFENRQYQEDHSTGVPVEPPLPLPCSPDKRYELSARQICCVSRYTDTKFFSKIVIIRSIAIRGVSPCTLFQGHVLQIQGLNFQEDKLTCY